MKELIERLIAEQKASGFRDIAGTHVEGRVPLTQALMNEAVAGALRGKNLPLKGATILVTTGNRLIIGLQHGILFAPKRVEITFPPQANLAEDPILRMRLHLGGLGGVLAGFAAALFPGKFPEGVSLSGDQLAIDMRRLLQSRNLGEFAPLLRSLRFQSETGTLWFGFTVAVPPQGEK